MRLYRFLSSLAVAAYAPYALIRSATGRRKIGGLKGRFGREPYPDLDSGVWVHAVSVGEVAVARNLIAEIARRSPGTRVGLSSTTAAGLALARRIAPQNVSVFAFPIDLAGPVERALAAVRPGLVLLTETEIWPLFLERAARRGIPCALVNGRLSERSFRRYRVLGRWFARVLRTITFFAMQTEEDADRIRCLGADPARVRVAGNAKYDLPSPPPFADAARLAATASGRPVIVAGSTGEGEDEIVLAAWESLAVSERPLLALAPRRPERFDAVARLILSRGLSLVRRSESAAPSPVAAGAAVYLLDSIGELASLYRESRLAFIGGSLVASGGHNPIEAWAAGAPVVVGPHTENFAAISADGERLGILERVADGPALAAVISAALSDPAALARKSQSARDAVERSRGAVAKTADFVLPLLRAGRERESVIA